MAKCDHNQRWGACQWCDLTQALASATGHLHRVALSHPHFHGLAERQQELMTTTLLAINLVGTVVVNEASEPDDSHTTEVLSR